MILLEFIILNDNFAIILSKKWKCLDQNIYFINNFSKDGISSFNNLEKIPQYPMRRHFHNLIENFQNINEIKKN